MYRHRSRHAETCRHACSTRHPPNPKTHVQNYNQLFRVLRGVRDCSNEDFANACLVLDGSPQLYSLAHIVMACLVLDNSPHGHALGLVVAAAHSHQTSTTIWDATPSTVQQPTIVYRRATVQPCVTTNILASKSPNDFGRLLPCLL